MISHPSLRRYHADNQGAGSASRCIPSGLTGESSITKRLTKTLFASLNFLRRQRQAAIFACCVQLKCGLKAMESMILIRPLSLMTRVSASLIICSFRQRHQSLTVADRPVLHSRNINVPSARRRFFRRNAMRAILVTEATVTPPPGNLPSIRWAICGIAALFPLYSR